MLCCNSVDVDEGVRHACAVTLQAITRRSPDVTRAHGALALPLAFLGMHQQKPTESGSDASAADSTAAVWEEVCAVS